MSKSINLIMKKLFLVLVAVTMTATIMGQQNSGEYVDLGLPSGILWKSVNEDGLFTWQQAIDKYGEQLPTKEELTELIEEARWFKVNESDVKAIGTNGKYIIFPADGYRACDGRMDYMGNYGFIWSSSKEGNAAWTFYFYSYSYLDIFFDMQTLCKGHNVRLVKRKAK